MRSRNGLSLWGLVALSYRIDSEFVVSRTHIDMWVRCLSCPNKSARCQLIRPTGRAPGTILLSAPVMTWP